MGRSKGRCVRTGEAGHDKHGGGEESGRRTGVGVWGWMTREKERVWRCMYVSVRECDRGV